MQNADKTAEEVKKLEDNSSKNDGASFSGLGSSLPVAPPLAQSSTVGGNIASQNSTPADQNGRYISGIGGQAANYPPPGYGYFAAPPLTNNIQTASPIYPPPGYGYFAAPPLNNNIHTASPGMQSLPSPMTEVKKLEDDSSKNDGASFSGLGSSLHVAPSLAQSNTVGLGLDNGNIISQNSAPAGIGAPAAIYPPPGYGYFAAPPLTNNIHTASPGMQISGFESFPSPMAARYSEINQDKLNHVAALNMQMAELIMKNVMQNPLVILTPVFKDYEKHLQSIKEAFDEANEKLKKLG